MKLYYSPSYIASKHAFDTTRKSQWIADSLATSPIPGVELVEPPPLTRKQVALVHGDEYIRAVETGEPRGLAESQGFAWDTGMWPMVLSSNGGVVAAARTALREGVSGSLSSGLHHARRDRGADYCTFNGLAIAAFEALAAGAGAVLILDLDAHCGGGTQSLIAGEARVWHADVSVCDLDRYPASERNLLDLVRHGDGYLSAVERMLAEVKRRGPRFELCLYNAGMDPHEDCDVDGLPGVGRTVLARRERLVFDWCRTQDLPVAFVLAGGYSGTKLKEDELVGLHRMTLSSAVEISKR